MSLKMKAEMIVLVKKIRKNTPGSKSPLSPIECIELGEYLIEWFNVNPNITQTYLIEKLHLESSRFKNILTIGRWPLSAKDFVKANHEKFSQTILVRIAKESYRGNLKKTGTNGEKIKGNRTYYKKRTLLNSLKRYAEGKSNPVRLQKMKPQKIEISPEIHRMEDILRSKLYVRPKIDESNNIIELHCGNKEQVHRVFEEICNC